MKGLLFQRTSSEDRIATATNEMHNNDVRSVVIFCSIQVHFGVFLDMVIFVKFNAINLEFSCSKVFNLYMY